MKKPHIRKVKGSLYWACDGVLAKSPRGAFVRWQISMGDRRFRYTGAL